MAKNFVLEMNRFLGLVRNGTMDPAVGASPKMINFKVGESFSLEKRKGYTKVFFGDGRCRGIWQGKIEGESVFLAVFGNALYASREGFSYLSPVEGEVPGEEKVNFVPFFDGVYLLTGAGIRRFDGQALSEIQPHVPLVMISTAPDGAGVSFEEINLLSPYFRQSFSPDGTSREFVPVTKDVSAIVSVKLNGKEMDTNKYYLDEVHYRLVFAEAPKAGTDTIEATFLLYREEDPSPRILNCRYGLGFGGANDTRVFLYGNPDTPAVRYHSGVVDGKPSFAYFPAFGYTFVGTGAPITAMIRHYDRQLIFTEQAAYYSYLEYMTGENGKLVASFPVLPLSDDLGCSAPGQAITVENTPVTATPTGLFRWVTTNVRDERNAICLSDAIADALQEEKASRCLLFYRKASSELFAIFGNRAFVYHTGRRVFYYYEFAEAIGGFEEVESELYFFTEDGICLVGGESDDGEEIGVYWESGGLYFGSAEKEKKLFGAALVGKCPLATRLFLSFSEENGEEEKGGAVTLPSGRDDSFLRLRLPVKRFRRGVLSLRGGEGNELELKSILLRGRMMDQ